MNPKATTFSGTNDVDVDEMALLLTNGTIQTALWFDTLNTPEQNGQDDAKERSRRRLRITIISKHHTRARQATFDTPYTSHLKSPSAHRNQDRRTNNGAT
jgi:hypothetical protein